METQSKIRRRTVVPIWYALTAPLIVASIAAVVVRQITVRPEDVGLLGPVLPIVLSAVFGFVIGIVVAIAATMAVLVLRGSTRLSRVGSLAVLGTFLLLLVVLATVVWSASYGDSWSWFLAIVGPAALVVILGGALRAIRIKDRGKSMVTGTEQGDD
jgi:FtsH-binding integral membrane protein